MNYFVRLIVIFVGVAFGACEKKSSKASLPTEAPKQLAEEKTFNETKKKEEEDADKPAEDGEANTSPAEQKKSDPRKDNSDAIAARLIGEVEAVHKAELSFRVSGYVDKILVLEGQAVKKGDVLATLDQRDFQIRMQQAKAKVELAHVMMENAQKEFEREQRLKEDKVATAASYDRTLANYEQARLNKEMAQLDFTQAKQALGDTKLIAPYDSVIAQRFKDEQEFIKDGTGMFKIYDLGMPEIKLQAPERFAGEFQLGSKLTVSIPAANFSGDAVITRIVPVISEQSRTFTVYAKVSDESAKLSPGSYAEAILQ